MPIADSSSHNVTAPAADAATAKEFAGPAITERAMSAIPANSDSRPRSSTS
jgi:hypothetical protein